MDGYASLGIMLLLAFVFPVMPLIVAPMLQPRQPNAEKQIPYECGVDTIGKTRVRFHQGYFMYALVFLLFDVETVFLYPWAVKYSRLGLFALCEMLVFVGILIIGLWYAWKKGALSWK